MCEECPCCKKMVRNLDHYVIGFHEYVCSNECVEKMLELLAETFCSVTELENPDE